MMIIRFLYAIGFLYQISSLPCRCNSRWWFKKRGDVVKKRIQQEATTLLLVNTTNADDHIESALNKRELDMMCLIVY